MNYFVTTNTSSINFKNYYKVQVLWAIALLWGWLQNIPNWNTLTLQIWTTQIFWFTIMHKKVKFYFPFFKTHLHHGYLTVLFDRITVPFLKNTTSVPLFFVILQCFLLYVSFLSISVLFGNVLYSFIRRHSDDNGLVTKGAEATRRTMATTTTTAAESIRLD